MDTSIVKLFHHHYFYFHFIISASIVSYSLSSFVSEQVSQSFVQLGIIPATLICEGENSTNGCYWAVFSVDLLDNQ